MTRELSRKEYTDLFGATEGDRLRLGDTSLLAEIEHDHTTYGDEAVFGGGKTMRDGMGMRSGVTQAEGALDWVFSNVVAIGPIRGIKKGDIGVRNGRIAGIGKAGNPDTMDGVDDDLVIGPSTDTVPADGLIATPGGLDIHVHFNSTGLFEHALASGNSSQPDPLYEQIEAGACGLKLHEDWGSTPAVIDSALTVADDTDVQVCIHTDTLNESGFVEKTFDAIDGRAIHTFHIEGAGGGHAPDVLELVGHEHMLPSSTNPSMPYTENTFDEHLDMVMVCHHLNPDVPEDVAFAESRIRAETIAAEDVLHDQGAISMMTSDSQAMGRMAEVIARTWQTADKMKKQRGPLPEDEGTEADNHRIKRYVAKYTINPAKVAGIDEYVGSLEPGKMADIVLWEPEFFGIKPKYVIKGGFPVYSQMGEANGSLMTCEPVEMRPRAGAMGKAKHALSVTFVSEAAHERGIGAEYGLDTPVRPVEGTRSVRKADMVHNDYCPEEIDIDAQTFEVSIDGEHVTCEPAEEIALAQRYHL